MKRIFAWQTDTAGCFMYRIYWPLNALNKDRFEVAWGAPPPDIFDYDVVIGQRLAGHNPLWQELCRNPNIFTVYDIDDDLINIGPENPVPYSIYHPVVDETIANIAMADMVTVASEAFSDWLLSRKIVSSQIAVLRNCLPRAWMEYRPPPAQPVVGWAGSMFHAQDWDPDATKIVAGLRLLKEWRPEIDFHMIGANYLGSGRTTAWSTMDAYHSALNFTVGVAPLQRSTFNNHKSHCKLLEYASKGIPAVASFVNREYIQWIDSGRNGYLLDDLATADTWATMIENCLDDAEALGRAAYRKALQYTIEGNIHLWEKIYES